MFIEPNIFNNPTLVPAQELEKIKINLLLGAERNADQPGPLLKLLNKLQSEGVIVIDEAETLLYQPEPFDSVPLLRFSS